MIPTTLVSALRDAKLVVVLTGAGVSAESNIPTFRDAMTGLWARYDPQELATPEAFLRNPKLVWEWYAWRRSLCADAKPNPGHEALAALATHVPNLIVVTQNVDGLHHMAGSRRVLELHGNIKRTKCLKEKRVVESWCETDQVPPRCPQCDSMLRPDVVWFGEPLPKDVLDRANQAAANCDLFLSVGTSSQVYPAAGLVYLARRFGAKTAEINPDATVQAEEMDWAVAAPSGEALPALLAAAFPPKD